MKTIAEENLVSFKNLEQDAFAYVSQLGREMTQIMLEVYDTKLAEWRDKNRYRDKRMWATTVKAFYGEVAYTRRVSQTNLEER